MVERFMYHPHSGSALENNQAACIVATVDAYLVAESPVVSVPVRRKNPPLVQRYLNVFLRYAGIGIIGTTAHFAVLFLMVGLTTPVVASTLGAITGCVTNFRLSRSYVFTAHPVLSFGHQSDRLNRNSSRTRFCSEQYLEFQ